MASAIACPSPTFLPTGQTTGQRALSTRFAYELEVAQ